LFRQRTYSGCPRHPFVTKMGFITIVVAALAALSIAKPIPDPIQVIRQSGPAAGQVYCDPFFFCPFLGGIVEIYISTSSISIDQKLKLLTNTSICSPLRWRRFAELKFVQVITKCNAPGQLALAYDDGPSQYTQELVTILNAGGAKGTFFVTGQLYVHTPVSPPTGLY